MVPGYLLRQNKHRHQDATRFEPGLLRLLYTAALDSESELQITQAISNLFSGRTVIIIAHRLSTIRQADIIHVVEDGRIVQSGGHQDLLSEGGLYKKLHDLQYQDLGL